MIPKHNKKNQYIKKQTIRLAEIKRNSLGLELRCKCTNKQTKIQTGIVTQIKMQKKHKGLNMASLI